MHTNLDYLFAIEPPWIYVGIGEPERLNWNPSHFYWRPGLNVCVRRLRGRKMRTTRELMNEISAALQFFDGFGENWTALEECLQYLDEWIPADAYILVIEDAQEVLSTENGDGMAAFLRTLQNVGDWWSKPIVDDDRFNRPAIPFHVLLHVSTINSACIQAVMKIADEASVALRV